MNFSLYTDFALNLKESQLQEVDVEKRPTWTPQVVET